MVQQVDTWEVDGSSCRTGQQGEVVTMSARKVSSGRRLKVWVKCVARAASDHRIGQNYRQISGDITDRHNRFNPKNRSEREAYVWGCHVPARKHDATSCNANARRAIPTSLAAKTSGTARNWRASHGRRIDSGHDTHGAGAAVGICLAGAELTCVSFRRHVRHGKEASGCNTRGRVVT